MPSCRTEVSRSACQQSLRDGTDIKEASEAPRRTFAEVLIECEEDRTLRAARRDVAGRRPEHVGRYMAATVTPVTV
jgi:hypothetical protein